MPSSSRAAAKKRTLSTADLVVLSLIAEGPRHGYAVYTELRRRQVEEWASVSRAQIYYSLDKLAGDGHIVAARDPEDALGPERAVYRLAAAGARALRTALADASWATRTAPAPFLTWALLAWYADPAARAHVVAEREKHLDLQIAHARETLAAIRRDDSHATTPLVVVELLVEQFEVERRWLGRLKRDKWIANADEPAAPTGRGARRPA